MKKITKSQYLQLEGIRAISSLKNRELEDLVLVVASITGEELDESNYGLAADFIFTPDETVKTHLKKLRVEIEK